MTITFPATSKTCCVALDFVKELPRNPRMLAKARTKIVRRRAVLRGVDAMLDIVDQLINPTGRDLMKDMGAELSLRQIVSTSGLWGVSSLNFFQAPKR